MGYGEEWEAVGKKTLHCVRGCDGREYQLGSESADKWKAIMNILGNDLKWGKAVLCLWCFQLLNPIFYSLQIVPMYRVLWLFFKQAVNNGQIVQMQRPACININGVLYIQGKI